jgi:hypothetical protein
VLYAFVALQLTTLDIPTQPDWLAGALSLLCSNPRRFPATFSMLFQEYLKQTELQPALDSSMSAGKSAAAAMASGGGGIRETAEQAWDTLLRLLQLCSRMQLNGPEYAVEIIAVLAKLPQSLQPGKRAQVDSSCLRHAPLSKKAYVLCALTLAA